MLAEKSYQLGITKFDLSGIDPDKNPGVYSFIKGTGSFQVNFQGEWEIASPKWLLPIASRLVSQRIS
jgi:lipid II:glycine glycyltransferase (peptidoglycan interpeptide bridge formation enzyme)